MPLTRLHGNITSDCPSPHPTRHGLTARQCNDRLTNPAKISLLESFQLRRGEFLLLVTSRHQPIAGERFREHLAPRTVARLFVAFV
ncbi:hypothetical protein J6590_059455 [Homalodisca vitripennis]|nr:hypothetical protein J6590_059455 [Homalodisca vitripennis]